MHPTYVKLKLPVKAIRVLILIMVLVQFCSCGDGFCFGSVREVIISAGSGYVGINNKTQIELLHEESYFYSIPVTKPKLTFYLFEERTGKFLCWKKKSLKGMVVMGYKKINHTNHWQHCRFQEKPADKQKTTHVNLYLANDNLVKLNDSSVRMQFSTRLKKNLPLRRNENCSGTRKKFMIHTRHHKKCVKSDDEFMVKTSDKPNCCKRAYKMFCKTEMRVMPELSNICNELLTKGGNCN